MDSDQMWAQLDFSHNQLYFTAYTLKKKSSNYKGAATIDTNTRSCPPGPHKLAFSCTENIKNWPFSCTESAVETCH